MGERLWLYGHQVEAVRWAERLMASVGGAIVADEVGLGKSYVALAVLHRAGGGVVVCPKVLVPQWEELVWRYGLGEQVEVCSFGKVGGGVAKEGGVLVVDEAHHVRNRGTRRWARVAGLAHGRRVLCLTGTPLHNAADDLAGVLDLFVSRGVGRAVLGGLWERRDEWSVSDVRLVSLMRAVLLRRGRKDVRMAHRGVCWRVVDGEEGAWVEELASVLWCLGEELELHRGVLAMWGRRWASSLTALRRSIQRAKKRAEILEDGVRCGWALDGVEIRRSLRLLEGVEEDWFQMELGFGGGLAGDWRYYREVQERLTCLLGEGCWRREGEWLRWIVDVCEGGGLTMVFSRYVHSARALWRMLRVSGVVSEVLLLSGDGAWHGHWGRGRLEDGIVRAQGWRRSDGCRVIVMTPLGVEGLNFPEVGRIVHMDLPDTWARVEQRVGRADRLLVEEPLDVVVRRLPAAVEEISGVEERVNRKRVMTEIWKSEVMGGECQQAGAWADALGTESRLTWWEGRKGTVRVMRVQGVTLRYGVSETQMGERVPHGVEGWRWCEVGHEAARAYLVGALPWLSGSAAVEERIRHRWSRYRSMETTDVMELSMRACAADICALESVSSQEDWDRWQRVVMGRGAVGAQLLGILD